MSANTQDSLIFAIRSSISEEIGDADFSQPASAAYKKMPVKKIEMRIRSLSNRSQRSRMMTEFYR